MAILEGFRVRNYGVLKDVTLGRLWNYGNDPLTPITTVIGQNGVGKSVLLDSFGFLADSFKVDVEAACDERGGFNKIRSQGTKEPIAFDVYYREHKNVQPITYQVIIGDDQYGRPYVIQERLMQRQKGQKTGEPFTFLRLDNGVGVAWKGDNVGYQKSDFQHIKSIVISSSSEKEKEQFKTVETKKGSKLDDYKNRTEVPKQLDLLSFLQNEEFQLTEKIELEDPRKLGIATLGSLREHSRISAFRRFIEGWYLSYFTPDAARSLPLAGPQQHLNVHGDNLCNVVQYMEKNHSQRLETVLKKMADKIPGINKINTEESIDGRLLLSFNDKGFQEPFFAQQMSDGTLKLFAYLLLLEDPTPFPFLCIEEPENGLYHKLLEILVNEFREHATGLKGSPQVFITTHQPYILDALYPNEVWILSKGEDGYSNIHRASENPLIDNLVEEGLPLGGLWYSDYIDPRL